MNTKDSTTAVSLLQRAADTLDQAANAIEWPESHPVVQTYSKLADRIRKFLDRLEGSA